MLLNAGKEERSKGSRVATLLGVPGVMIGAVLVAWTLIGRSSIGRSTTQSVSIGALWGAPQDIARLLFHEFLLPFEVTSVLILIAIMGAVVLTSKPEAVARGQRKDG
jgi:NADH-quinone oxidoreductase subunit J